VSLKILPTKSNKMCIIIIKQKDKKVSKETLKTSAKINPHGLGIVWLDTFEISYHKSKEYLKLYTERPFIAHFRFATIGKVNRENTHPFQCGSNKDEYLMMNGTIMGLGNKKECDTKILARTLGNIPRHKWKSHLEKEISRFVTINVRTRSFQIYNRDLYTHKNGIWYSKDNVLQDNLIAVYGTLKKGYSNYNHYLRSAKYIGSGKTKDKYPMIIDGLPYVLKNKGLGKNVNVDVFKVSNTTFKEVDKLESHPNWYFREEVEIKMSKGRTLKCWLYFNKKKFVEGMSTHSNYTQSVRPFWYSGYDLHRDTPEWKPDTRSIGWDRVEDESDCQVITDTEVEPYCPACFHTLKDDSFGGYYCGGCNGWFTEREILTDNE
jgi:gamma-glutamylaminecyclotransferase